mmetsp:Transcript_13399/g.11895  ORF Transcript_13399/g.11895 Transcript_13399/m.11895 type:complete len:112 (+) Transcript_13399:237-572(+)
MNELTNFELDIFVMYPEEVLLNQKSLTNCSHLYNASNNDKTWNKHYTDFTQNKYVTGEDKSDEKDLQSLTSINLLKRDYSNATEIGKNVAIRFIDLTLKRKTKQAFKNIIS